MHAARNEPMDPHHDPLAIVTAGVAMANLGFPHLSVDLPTAVQALSAFWLVCQIANFAVSKFRKRRK